jgi:VIT1/CCC1 family predicted Fe2+/Mn2+ transporter
MTALEFGIVSSERWSSVLVSLMSGDVFAFGALPSVVPFAFSGINPISGLIAVAVITLACAGGRCDKVRRGGIASERARKT